MKNFIIWFLVSLPYFVFSQLEHINYVSSQGAVIQSANGNYTSTIIIGEPISSSILSNTTFDGSNYGFLYPEEFGNPPIANAGIDQIVLSNSIVTLDGTLSSDPENNILTYQWVSLDGIVLNNSSTIQPTFTSPIVIARKKYSFELTVSDGLSIDKDTVCIEVSDPSWEVTPLSNSSSLIAEVKLDNTYATDDDWVAAFVNGQIRGVSRVFTYNGVAFISMLIQLESQKDITFEIFDCSENTICTDPNVLTLLPSQIIGDPINPYLINGNCTGGCVPDLTINNFPIMSNTYNASNNITSTGTVASTSTVVFEAGLGIDLLPGFCVEPNSEFSATIVPCTQLTNHNSSLDSNKEK